LSHFGGFDHNAQALRIVTDLERRYAAFDGLNLTWETLEGLVKHNGPLTDREGRAVGRYRERGVPAAILAYAQIQDLELWSFAGAEAQVAALSDDIAYDAHDIDDGLRADLFTLDDIAAVGIIGDIVREIDAQFPALDSAHRVHETVRHLITRMIEDVIAETGWRVAALKLGSAADVRHGLQAMVAFSPTMEEADADIKGFLRPRMYRHVRVMRVMDEAQAVVRDLFAHYTETPSDLPAEWAHAAALTDESARARHIADYIAGMTDRYALIEHAKYFKATPELR
jgi:dGTPase